MAAKVYLDDLIDAMDSAVDDGTSYVDRETGEVHYVSREVMNLVENDEPVDSLPDWQQHEVESARLVVETDRMVATPSPFDIHEWEIMQEFALCLERKGLRRRAAQRPSRQGRLPALQGHPPAASDRRAVV